MCARRTRDVDCRRAQRATRPRLKRFVPTSENQRKVSWRVLGSEDAPFALRLYLLPRRPPLRCRRPAHRAGDTAAISTQATRHPAIPLEAGLEEKMDFITNAGAGFQSKPRAPAAEDRTTTGAPAAHFARAGTRCRG